jgi:glycosyltransferase involved in cell wall biosynthesis
LRILHISSAQIFGGGERNLVDLTEGLQRRGHQVQVVVRPNSTLLQRLSHVPARNVHVLPLRNALDVQSANALARLVKRERIEIIHAHMARDYSLAAYATRRNRQSRLIITRHVLFPLKRLHNQVLSRVSRVIAVSQAVAAQLQNQNLMPSNKITVVQNGVNIAHLRNVTSETDRSDLCWSWGFPADSLVVGSIGELIPLKGHDVFLRAASIVSKKFARARFLIAGGDHSPKKETQADLKKLINELALQDRVRMIGEVAEVGPVLLGMDLFVSASRNESFGLAIIEAMASGVPVVATATAGAREVVREGETGRIVARDQPDEMAEAILELLTDAEARTRMAEHASRTAAERFHIDRMIDAVEQIYCESLATDSR